MQEQVSIMCSWCGLENAFLGLRAASLVTAYAALRLRDGFSYPHQEHMKDTYNSSPLVVVVTLNSKTTNGEEDCSKLNEWTIQIRTRRFNTI